jgi:hypothetical protein
MPLQIRRGTEEERLAMSVPLAPGELLYVTDDKRIFVGDGISIGESLIPVTGYTNEDAQDAAAALILSGDHNNITWTYSDENDKLSSTLDLSTYIGEISADGFRGNLVGDDSTILVKALNSSINLDGTIKGNVIPDLTGIYNLGSEDKRFKRLYVEETEDGGIWLGNAQIFSNGSIINLPAGSLIGGEPIAAEDDTVSGLIEADVIGDLKGSVFGDDSTTLIDSIRNIISNGVLTFSGNNISSIEEDRVTFGTKERRNNLIIYAESFDPGIEINSVLDGGPGLTQTGPIIRLSSFKGNLEDPAILDTGDLLGQIQLAGFINANGVPVTADLAAVRAVVDHPGSSTTIANAKLQFFLADQSNPIDSAVFEFNNQGVLSAPVMQVGSYTDSPDTRPAGVKGMIIFNDTSGKFQGFDGNTWVDLNSV